MGKNPQTCDCNRVFTLKVPTRHANSKPGCASYELETGVCPCVSDAGEESKRAVPVVLLDMPSFEHSMFLLFGVA